MLYSKDICFYHHILNRVPVWICVFVSKINVYDFIQPPGLIVTQRYITRIFGVVFFSSNQVKNM